MKRFLLIILTVVLFITGCAVEEDSIPETRVTEPTVTETTVTEMAPAAATENTDAEATMPDGQPLDAYMASLEKQAKVIREALEHEAVTQPEMNQKSQELYDLWDGALNDLWAAVKSTLPEDEFLILLDEQRLWIAEKEEAVKKAGEGYEAGSIYYLIVNTEAAQITEERVYELLALLQ